MNKPQLAQAAEYAIHRLEGELPPELCYHSVEHTRREVVPGVYELAALEGIDGETLVLLVTAAFYHDIGFIEQRENHEQVSVRIAREVLPGYGYSDAQIDEICKLILATRLPHAPANVSEAILADADMRVLGYPDFLQRNEDLRCELDAAGQVEPDEVWYRTQLRFLSEHHYFTAAARSAYEPGKQANIQAFEALLARYREAS